MITVASLKLGLLVTALAVMVFMGEDFSPAPSLVELPQE
jgi:hypothetical protein